MYLEHPLTDDIRMALGALDPAVRNKVLSLFAAYESLLRTAERDRECLTAVLDVIGVRLDQVHPHPETPPGAAREVVMWAFRRYVEDQEEMARADGRLHGTVAADVLADVGMPEEGG